MSGRAGPGLRLALLGQGLIRHDLRAHPWPNFAALAQICGQHDLCFTDLETAIRSPLAEAPTREGYFCTPPIRRCSIVCRRSQCRWWRPPIITSGISAPGGSPACCERSTSAGLFMPAPAPIWPRPQPRLIGVPKNGTVALVALASGSIHEGAAATASRAGVNELRLGSDGEPDVADLARILSAIAAAAGQADIVLAYHHNHIFDDESQAHASPERGRAGEGSRRAAHTRLAAGVCPSLHRCRCGTLCRSRRTAPARHRDLSRPPDLLRSRQFHLSNRNQTRLLRR